MDKVTIIRGGLLNGALLSEVWPGAQEKEGVGVHRIRLFNAVFTPSVANKAGIHIRVDDVIRPAEVVGIGDGILYHLVHAYNEVIQFLPETHGQPGEGVGKVPAPVLEIDVVAVRGLGVKELGISRNVERDSLSEISE